MKNYPAPKLLFQNYLKIPNFQNPELMKIKSQNLQYTYKILTISSLKGQLSVHSQTENDSEKLLLSV